MERTYWEKIAPAYEEQIFDVLKQDKRSLIRKAIIKHASPAGSVIDLGCAVGKWLPVIAPLFNSVTAVDISAINLRIARDTHPGLDNVIYKRADLSSSKTRLGQFDMAICINAILSESLPKRTRFFQLLSRTVKPGGYLVLAVPSLESWLLTRIIQQQFGIDRKLFNTELPNATAARRYRAMGNVEIDDIATKHYLAEELELLLSREGFTIAERKKLEYGWDTEFVKAPAWLTRPGPWDWMLVCRRDVE